MNSRKINKAIKTVYKDLKFMDKDKFNDLLKKHMNGEFADILMKNWKESQERAKKEELFNFLRPIEPKEIKIGKFIIKDNKKQNFIFGLIIGIILMSLFMIFIGF
jgi:tetrahydromethanopterin S-methyltransferase subunit B